MPVLLALSMGLAAAISLPFLGILVIYCVLTTTYSFLLKRKALLDVLSLAGLYTLRVIGGAVVLGTLAIGLGILAREQNVAFLVALAFAVAAAANLPTILYSLYWRRFNTRGALWSMYGGLISTIAISSSTKAS